MGYEQIFEMAATLGVDAALKPARTWQAKADELSRWLKATRAAEEAEYAKAVESLVAGTVSPADAGARTSARWEFDSPASNLIVAASTTCYRNADAATKAAGPALFKALQGRVSAIVTESAKLNMSLPGGVNLEASALRASNGDQRHFRTWSRLVELLAIWDACHELNRLLQKAGLVDGPTHPRDRTDARTYEAYKAPHQLAGIKGPVPLPRHLAAAVAAGAGPGLYGWGDACARARALDRRQYRPIEVITRHDGLGNVVASAASEPKPMNDADYNVSTKSLVG
jgi:hypothetical protein